jgi:hypothetical protein
MVFLFWFRITYSVSSLTSRRWELKAKRGWRHESKNGVFSISPVFLPLSPEDLRAV